jgi:glycerophosphoryl diester phosphodiesterase
VPTAVDTHREISVARAAAFGGVMPDHHYVSLGWLARLKRARVPVYVWTVNTPAGWTTYRGKVTGLLTDRAAEYDGWRQTHCQ